MSLFMLCVVCSLDAGRLLMVVNAQPTADATILTPPVDRWEGGRVEIRCVAMNLQANHTVEWAIKDPNDNTKNITLRWGSSTLTRLPRYEFTTMQTNGVTTQEFTITDLQISDADEYVCKVADPLQSGGVAIVASDSVTLSVLDRNFQFPNVSFPMCFPDGPITIDAATELNMRCLSEGMNSAIMMDVSQIPPASNSFTWTPSNTAETLLMSLDLTVDEAHDGISYACVISSVSYSEVRRSCTIGPISVTEPVEPTKETTKTAPDNSESDPMCSSVALLFVSIALFAVSLSVNIFLVCRVLQQKRLLTSIAERKTAPKPEPYMELQPTAKQNTEYMEPVRETTTTEQHTYYQAVHEGNETPEYDYVKPEGD